MNEFMSDIQTLVDRLATVPQAEHGIEAQALALLAPLLRALETHDTSAVTRHQARLRAFWLQCVPWCSSLSRELEKVLIQLEELGGPLPDGAIGG
jgi:hypothetical protein